MQLISTIMLSLMGLQAQAYQSGNAPFCSMDNYGNKQCYYYTLDACEDAVRYQSGKYCVGN